MKILVTGGAGFIGSNLVRHILQRTDHEVINVDRLTYAGNLASIADIYDHPRLHFEQVNICDSHAIGEIFRRHAPVAVMHLAAESHVDRSIDGPAAFISTNILGTFNMLQAAREFWTGNQFPGGGTCRESSKHRFIHVSTDEVYGSLTPDDPPFSEISRYDPRSPYSASKAASDHLVRAWGHTYQLPVIITNCSNNYGPYQFPEKLIPMVILKCLRGEPIPVYGTGENIRDWLYVEDHCRAMLKVLEKGDPGSTYNIGGDNEKRNVDLVHQICEIVREATASGGIHKEAQFPHDPDSPSLIRFVNDRPGHDLRYAINADKISRELDWRPLEGLESGLRKTVLWYLENREWWEAILLKTYKLERLGIEPL